MIHVASLTEDVTVPGESIIILSTEKGELVMRRIGQKRETSSRTSYEESSGDSGIEKDVL